MKLSHFSFESTFDVTPEIINVLVIEDEDRYFLCQKEMREQADSGRGGFTLTDKELEIPFNKRVCFINDYLDISLNDKRNLTKLYARLQEIVDNKFQTEFSKVKSSINSLLSVLNAETDYPIDFDLDTESANLFKALSVRFIENDDSLLGKIISLMHFLSGFTSINCFIFSGLKNNLRKDALYKLYHDAELHEISLFLLENTLKEKLNGERITVLDRDLCEFIV